MHELLFPVDSGVVPGAGAPSAAAKGIVWGTAAKTETGIRDGRKKA